MTHVEYASMLQRRLPGFGLGHWAFMATVMLLIGCATDPAKKPTTFRERQDAALRDPYGYKPENSSRDVSGGGLLDYDREGMRKDFNNVFNP